MGVKNIFQINILLAYFICSSVCIFAANTVNGDYNSVLSTGNWFKIKTVDEGIHKITYSQLKKVGIANPEALRIYGNGGSMLYKNITIARKKDLEEVPVYFNSGKDGVFGDGDYILFYAKGNLEWEYKENLKFFKHRQNLYSDHAIYFITSDMGKGKTLQTQDISNSAVTTEVNTYDHLMVHESEYTNIIHSGAQWFGEKITTGSPYSFTFQIPNIIQVATRVYFNVVAKAASVNSIYLNQNNQQLVVVQTSYIDVNSTEGLAVSEAGSFAQFVTDNKNLTFEFGLLNDEGSNSNVYVDYLELNTRANLLYNGKQFRFRDINSRGVGSVARFTISGATNAIQVWDVTDCSSYFAVKGDYSNGSYSIVTNTDYLKEFVVFNADEDAKTPIFFDKVQAIVLNQNLHGLAPVDLIIVSPSEKGLYLQAQRMADLRSKSDGLKVALVTTDQIYNEFSTGMSDVTAIRDFAKYMFDKSIGNTTHLKYLLLFGDGSFENKYTSKNNPRYIPTYQSDNSFHHTLSYVTDDFFGWLNDSVADEESTLDIGVGRFPVKDSVEARQVVDKYYQYAANNFGDWRNTFCFLADDEDGNIHMIQSNILADTILSKKPESIVKKVFLDAYPQKQSAGGNSYPDVVKLFGSIINNGVLMVNYTGHGNEKQLTSENVINKTTISSWRNSPRYPLFITATCEFSRFDDVGIDVRTKVYSDKTAAGEQILLQPNAGAIAMLTTTRLVYSYDNNNLNHAVFKFFFQKDTTTGLSYRIGDVIRLAKNYLGNNVNKLNFTLLGDPSLCIAYPKRNGVVTDSVNGVKIDVVKDTIKALQKIKISGHISTENNETDTLYDGEVNLTLLDKEILRSTLNNDKGLEAFRYKDRSVALFKGKASVTKGRFVFNIMMPKDINYSFGEGKLVYYAQNGKTDLNGFQSKLTIGGISPILLIDKTGPEMDVFMNDFSFKSGDITNDQPVLLVKLADINGINISEMGIGHEISAVIDGDVANALMLNNFYTSSTDNYTNGMVKYRLTGLNNGLHTIEVKAYDALNNMMKKTISFNVVSQEQLFISNVKNYPNPFNTQTTFEVTHNRAEENIEVELRIYSLMGEQVKQIKVTSYSTSFKSLPITWNGTNDNGKRMNSGIYVYRIVLKTKTGETAFGSGKLMIK